VNACCSGDSAFVKVAPCALNNETYTYNPKRPKHPKLYTLNR